MAKSIQVPLREKLSLAFTLIEDTIYVGLGLLLAGVAAALLVTEIVFFSQYILARRIVRQHRYAARPHPADYYLCRSLVHGAGFFRQHLLQPGPFLVVGLIAVIRRILVLTAELPKMVKENEAIFYNAMIELGLLTVLIVALVVSPTADSAERSQCRSGRQIRRHKLNAGPDGS